MAAILLDIASAFDAETPEMGLPIANAENKELQADVQRKEREVAELQRQAEHLRDRVQAMGDHLKNVQQELQQTQVGELVQATREAICFCGLLVHRGSTRQERRMWGLSII